MARSDWTGILSNILWHDLKQAFCAMRGLSIHTYKHVCVCISGVEQKASLINAKHSLRMELSVTLWNKNRLFVFNKAQGRNAHLAYL